MKRKILVLDAFTNGHEAALAFIQRQGWKEPECEIVFCGNHSNVLKQLISGASYAVVPIKNSIAGEVKEVTDTLMKLRDIGYNLTERDHLDLQINHCLLVPWKIESAEELDEVMSHEKAIQQCGNYLNKIGIAPDKRSKRDSTGNAAKALTKLGQDAKVGAIAPKAAAIEYGLKILAQDIQDVPDNKTTFLLLHNQAVVEPFVVGIIGDKGRFGQMLRDFFKRLGCTVIGADEKDIDGRVQLMRNVRVVAQSNVIIFSVPINRTPDIIRSLLPHIRDDQLIMDVTSIKQPAMEAMLESQAQVVGLHPMFRPEVAFDGQTVVVCPARLTEPRMKTWVVNVLAATGSNIKWSTAAEHDAYMLPVQVNPHVSNLVSALLMSSTEVSVSESLDFTSPFYRILFSLMGRLVSQSPDLYTSIIMENPGTVKMLERRIAIERSLVEIIRNKDRDSLEKLFGVANQHFGEKVTREANELFMRILSVLNTLYGKNSITLEFDKEQSRPGLLERIANVFGQRKINLTGINSVTLDGKRLQFTISFEQSGSSDQVRRALEEIEGWSEKVIVLKH